MRIGRCAAYVCLAALAACSGSSTAAPRKPDAPGPSAFGTRSVVLICPGPSGTNLPHTPDDVDLVGAVLQGLGRSGAPASRAVDVGLAPIPARPGWHFRKAPVYLPAGVPPITLRLAAPGKYALGWVPSSEWTSGHRPGVARWAAESVTFKSCHDGVARYFGGILGATGSTCVPLIVASGSHRSARIKVSLRGGHC